MNARRFPPIETNHGRLTWDERTQIMAIINHNFAEEEAIEQEARTMLASYAQGARDVDPYRMFLLAKQKLAAKKGFIL